MDKESIEPFNNDGGRAVISLLKNFFSFKYCLRREGYPADGSERDQNKQKELTEMKTISIRLEDSIYEELGAMLDAMGQTKQTFYETFTRTALRERSIPFIIKAPLVNKNLDADKKMAAFAQLKAMRESITEDIDYEKEREEAMNEKYGIVD